MTPLTFFCEFWCGTAGGYTLLTLWGCYRLRRQLQQRPAAGGTWPPLWILRPCEGDEPNLEQNLASSLVPYPGPRRVLLLIPSATDPARLAAERVAQTAPEVTVLFTGVRTERNRKSAQLEVGYQFVSREAAAEDLVVQVDSDALLGDDALTDLVSTLGTDPRIGAVFAIPVELAEDTPGDRLAAGLLSASHHDFFAMAALSGLIGGVPAMAGALVLFRRQQLDAMGGFAKLEAILGEDFEIGRWLHQRGYKIAVARHPVLCQDRGRSIQGVLTRTARWATVVRQQRGALILGIPLFMACTPLLLALGAALAVGGERLPLGLVLLLAALRVALASFLRRQHGAPVSLWRALGLWLGAELLMLGSSFRALYTSTVTWRGRRLRILAGGVIET